MGHLIGDILIGDIYLSDLELVPIGAHDDDLTRAVLYGFSDFGIPAVAGTNGTVYPLLSPIQHIFLYRRTSSACAATSTASPSHLTVPIGPIQQACAEHR